MTNRGDAPGGEGAPANRSAATSQLIIDLFSARGYQLQGRYNTPLIHSAGELVVLSRNSSS